MVVGENSGTVLTSKRFGAFRAIRITAPLILVLVLIQAVMAGRGLMYGGNAITIHGGIGNLTFLVALAQLILVLLAGLRGPGRWPLVITNTLLFVLLIVQLGLGYGGNENPVAAWWHIPNGVFLFGVATVATCLAWMKAPVSTRTA
ncbi:MAG TPA: hypothetical protein VHA53_06275 [Nitrolancea sp.]|nr:hypothetical protein [Nitrolancea sp.]